MSAAAWPAPPAVDTYLRRATRLLPNRAAQDARAELLGNLWQACLDAQTTGLNPAEAWEDVLRAAGPAGPLAVGFAWTHATAVLRRRARWLLLGVAVGGAAYAASAQANTDPAPNPVLPATHRSAR